MVDGFQAQALSTRLGIPIIYGVDAVHGHGNVKGATIFPHNIGLGATRDPGLVQRVGAITAEEVRATGIPWNFAPCLCVTRDARWGRSYESFGEDPLLVSVLGTAAVAGLQGHRQRDLDQNDQVLATVKHFAGDGDTKYGTSAGDYTIDQGVTITNRRDFTRINLTPYWPAIRVAAAGSAMPSFSSVDWTEDGVGNPIKMHQNQELITGVLKGQMRLDGFVISDWEGIHQLPGDYTNQVRLGVNAGIDMFMEPNTSRDFAGTLITLVNANEVSQARIDDAVTRILTKKFELGLFEHPYADRAHIGEVGSAAHRAVARQAVAQSQVLLKNSGNALPLKRDANIYVAGRNADDVGNQSGGWTLTWQGFSENNLGNVKQQSGTSILDGIRQVAPQAQVTYSADGTAPTNGADVAVVAVGETPYSEGFGDVGGPQWGYDPADAGVPREPEVARAAAAGPRHRDTGLRAGEDLRRARGLRPAADRHRPARQRRRAGRLLATRHRGRRCRRRPVRPAGVHRQAAGELAEDGGAGAHQHRGPQLRPAVPLRVRPAHSTGALTSRTRARHRRRLSRADWSTAG